MPLATVARRVGGVSAQCAETRKYSPEIAPPRQPLNTPAAQCWLGSPLVDLVPNMRGKVRKLRTYFFPKRRGFCVNRAVNQGWQPGPPHTRFPWQPDWQPWPWKPAHSVVTSLVTGQVVTPCFAVHQPVYRRRLPPQPGRTLPRFKRRRRWGRETLPRHGGARGGSARGYRDGYQRHGYRPQIGFRCCSRCYSSCITRSA